MSTSTTTSNRTVERSKTSTATIIKMTDWSPIREPSVASAAVSKSAAMAAATANVVRTEYRLERQRSAPPSVANLDEARQMIARLTERNHAQGHLLQAWKQRLKQQNEMLFGLHREREEQMRLLTSQLLLLEANLRSKQASIDGLLNQRDRVISGQQDTIRALERELDRIRNCCDTSSAAAATSNAQQQTVSSSSNAAVRPQTLPLSTMATTTFSATENLRAEPVVTDANRPEDSSSPNSLIPAVDRSKPQVRVLGREQGDESLDDSDSAVVIDDDHRHSPTFAHNTPQQVKIIRSISDVVDSTRADLSIFRENQQPGILKSTRLVRNHQRRVMFLQPEETECDKSRNRRHEHEDEEGEIEEEDEEEDGSAGSSSSDDSPFNKRGHKTFLRGSFERMPVHQDSSRGGGLSSSSLRAASHCSNHRSVTRPRDVKFKKNNKCLSWTTSKTTADGCPPGLSADNREFQASFSHQV